MKYLFIILTLYVNVFITFQYDSSPYVLVSNYYQNGYPQAMYAMISPDYLLLNNGSPKKLTNVSQQQKKSDTVFKQAKPPTSKPNYNYESQKINSVKPPKTLQPRYYDTRNKKVTQPTVKTNVMDRSIPNEPRNNEQQQNYIETLKNHLNASVNLLKASSLQFDVIKPPESDINGNVYKRRLTRKTLASSRSALV